MTTKKPIAQSVENETGYEAIGSALSIKNVDTVRRMGDVLTVLSKFDALEIFILAKNGVKSELDTPYKIGLTKKQYYTRLKQLCDLGLTTKHDNSYVHTAFGSLVYNKHVVGLLNTVTNLKELEMIDLLKKSSKFDSQEISGFLAKIGLNDNNTAESTPIKIITSYEDMVTKAIEILDFAQKEIILMTRYPNELIINSMLKKANMGVTVKVLVDINMVDGYVSQEGNKMLITDKNTNERNQVVVNPFYPIKIERKYGKVPFSLLMTDESHVGLEIIDKHNPDRYSLSVYADDPNLGSQMKDIFNNLWKSASLNPPQLAKKTN
ncbi:MAG TPA: hypothetical protein VJ771_05110 [Candidatus Nitrosotalea sp.]|nr:hypothetical protein [Candidatus Nitrosotalea sp.]